MQALSRSFPSLRRSLKLSQPADFASAPSYLAELRLLHLENDDSIGPALARTFAKVVNSLTRGVGAPNRAPELRLTEVNTAHPEEDSGPIVGMARSYLVASAWLLREVELSDLDASGRSIAFNDREDEILLKLPMSKSDQKGAGAERRLPCICSFGVWDSADAKSICPVCAVRRQLVVLQSRFGHSFQADSDVEFPLFPTWDGHRPAKPTVIQAWSLVAMTGRPTGHSARRSGAKAKTRMRWALWQIQFFGRWASSSVLAYVEEAMAELTAKWSRPGSRPQSVAILLRMGLKVECSPCRLGLPPSSAP